MLRVRPGVALDPAALPKLERLQADVDRAQDYAARVADAKRRWASVKKDTSPFVEVKAALDAMCWGARRCAYCEDSVADEIEHFRPKDLYPEAVFAWTNYLYACGPCNGPKNNAFAVFRPGEDATTVVTRVAGATVLPPPHGEEVLLHPRLEDPLAAMILDLRETFHFRPHPSATPRARARADYTIRVLRLNDRAYLVEARRTAFASLVSALESAAERIHRGAPLDFARRAVEHGSHRSVWEEMKRQRKRITSLDMLFAAVPEAETW